MKLRFFSLLLVGLMAASTFAATIDQWIQDPAGDPVALSGNWATPAMWKTGTRLGFPNTYLTGDEFKLNSPYATTTINTTQTYANRLTVSGGYSAADAHKVLITSGANVAFTEMRVGHGNSSSQGTWGEVEQGSETAVTVDKLQLGYYGTRGSCKGTYTISGGTLLANGTGRLQIGAGITTGSTSANNEGVFTVVGTGGTVNAVDLYVGSYGGFAGTGTLEFQVAAGGVSRITVSSGITLDAAGASSVANLVVSNYGEYLGTIVLVENTGGSIVSGLFDSLNGGAAGEGATVTIAGGLYTLTYVYDAVTQTAGIGNDIALIPEPATIALLTLGLIAIRRNKK